MGQPVTSTGGVVGWALSPCAPPAAYLVATDGQELLHHESPADDTSTGVEPEHVWRPRPKRSKAELARTAKIDAKIRRKFAATPTGVFTFEQGEQQ